jgi:1-pyrroline-5-carboxylate dehydrogenase
MSNTATTAVRPFTNEPLTDFTRPENREAFQKALSLVETQLGRTYPLIIGGERVSTDDVITSTSPNDTTIVVGHVASAGVEHAERALDAAWKAFEGWQDVPGEERAQYLFRAAEIMRRRKHELSAWMVYEVGKTWPEADGDTAEAIDFLEFYAREMIRLSGPQPLTPLPGEKNALYYIPLGVGVVIPPWNFPLAILTGMSSAAAVTGNAVVLKPSSDSPIIAAKFIEVMEEAGLPAGVINFLPGPGGTVGNHLVASKRTRFVSFTGSKEVGLGITELAGKPQPGQIWIKRVVAEMGGKDAIVVDDEADIDAAATGIVQSAFGFQGQKCSACSRAIVVDKVYDEVVKRVEEKTRALAVGPAQSPETQVGPVVNKNAFRSILEYIDVGKKEGRVVAGGEPAGDLAKKGYFIRPTVIADVDRKARIAQEEIFGPVLAVIRAKDYDDALAIANDTEYGLTGSVYSKNREKLEKAARRFHVGNLYLNRKCTGAMVGGHPFGGFNMSGTDSKAGGHDYLLLFLQAKTVSEKVA